MAPDPRTIRRNKIRHVSIQVREAIKILDDQRGTLVALFNADLAIALDHSTPEMITKRAKAFEEAANCLDEHVYELKKWAIAFDNLG